MYSIYIYICMSISSDLVRHVHPCKTDEPPWQLVGTWSTKVNIWQVPGIPGKLSDRPFVFTFDILRNQKKWILDDLLVLFCHCFLKDSEGTLETQSNLIKFIHLLVSTLTVEVCTSAIDLHGAGSTQQYWTWFEVVSLMDQSAMQQDEIWKHGRKLVCMSEG